MNFFLTPIRALPGHTDGSALLFFFLILLPDNMSLRWKQLGLLAKHHAQPRAKGWRADGSEADPFRARLLAGLSDLKDSHILQDKVIDLEDEPLPMPIPTPEPEVQKPLLIYDRADGQQVSQHLLRCNALMGENSN